MEDIRDIYGLVPISSWFEILRYSIIGSCIFLLLVLIFLFLRSRRLENIKLNKSAEEIALDALREAKTLMSPERSREFAFRLSSILRTYIQARYFVSASSETTEEFLDRMADENDSELSSYSTLLKNFLFHCDIAKFAKAALSLPLLSDLYDSAWQFVEASRTREPDKEEGKP